MRLIQIAADAHSFELSQKSPMRQLMYNMAWAPLPKKVIEKETEKKELDVKE